MPVGKAMLSAKIGMIQYIKMNPVTIKKICADIIAILVPVIRQLFRC